MAQFIDILTKADNIPIVFMLVLVLFFTWVGFKQALRNDRLIEQGREEEILRRCSAETLGRQRVPLLRRSSMPFTIVAENCTGCTACEKRCPTKAISGDPKKAYYIEATLCIDCGACGVICPDEAILDTCGNVTKVLKRQERPIAIVHPDNCNGCGVCVDVCPFDCI